MPTNILSPDSPQSADTSCSRASQSSTSPKDRIATTTSGSDRGSDKFSWLNHYSVEANATAAAPIVSSSLSSPSLTSGLQHTTTSTSTLCTQVFFFVFIYVLQIDRGLRNCCTNVSRSLELPVQSISTSVPTKRSYLQTLPF